MKRQRARSFMAFALIAVIQLPQHAQAVRGDDSVVQFYCARFFANIAGPIEKVFLPKTAASNNYSSWTKLIENQISNPAAGTGAAFKVATKDAQQSVETIQWMIGALNGRTITKPWQGPQTQRLKKRLQDFESAIHKTGEIPWDQYLALSTDFSETMGRRAPIANPETFTNNLALDRAYIDSEIKNAVARQPYAIVMPTHRPMSIAEMNNISAYPVFPAELVAYRQKADRQLYYPMSYFGHDLNHGSSAARAFEKQIERIKSGEITRAQYQQYIAERVQTRVAFQAMAAKQPPKIQNALELLWFNFTHENIDNIGFTLLGEMNPAAMKQVAGLQVGNDSALVNSTLYHMNTNDIFDSGLPKPSEREIRDAFNEFKKFADSLPVTQ